MQMSKELTINRDNDKFAKFILGDYSWNIYHKGLEINAYDNNHIFSFFGENGVGKSSICRKIWNAERYSEKPEKSEIEKLKIIELNLMDVNYFINADLDSACVFYTCEKSDKKFSYYFKNILDMVNSIENTRCNKKAKYEKDFRKHNVFYNERDENISKFHRKYNTVNKIIRNYLEENNFEIEFTRFKKSQYIIDHTERDNHIYHIVDIIEAFTNSKKISMTCFFKAFEKYEKELKEYDELNYTSILSGNRKSIYIRRFLSDILLMVKEINCEYKKEVKSSNKIISYIDENLLEDFVLMSNSFVKKIYTETHYNSLLDLEYKKMLVVKNDKSLDAYEIKDFLNVISEGQKKLIKYLFIFSEIAIKADKKTIILADDIFDSFDNKNVVNILMLLNKVLKIKKPILLIFTHDFEIFGLINKRLDVKNGSSYIINRIDNNVHINTAQIKENTLEEYIKSKKCVNNKIEMKLFYFLVLITYGRSLIERTFGVDNIYYKNITCLMHIKKSSLSVVNKCHELHPLKFLDFFEKEDMIEIEKYSLNFKDYFELVNEIFNYIKNEKVFKIEYNIFLSLYSRLLIENELIKHLKRNDKNSNSSYEHNSSQTGRLLSEYKKMYGDNDFYKKTNSLNKHITKFIHIEQGISYIMNIDNEILLKLINDVNNYGGSFGI